MSDDLLVHVGVIAALIVLLVCTWRQGHDDDRPALKGF